MGQSFLHRLFDSQCADLQYGQNAGSRKRISLDWPCGELSIGPVANYRLGLVRLSERTDLTPNHVKDLGSAVIAVQRADFSSHWLEQQGMKIGKELQLSADIFESWRLLLKGKVDYVVDDEAALALMEKQLLQPQGVAKFVLAIPELEQQTYLAASKGSDAELVKKLQQAHLEVQKTQLYSDVMSGRF
jgi:polar amino acid transport system substrate-binding protein